uniref:hypothetical protein n=1 Tax=Butyricimonas virosa TaxID=544645 RepID=UPI004025DD41
SLNLFLLHHSLTTSSPVLHHYNTGGEQVGETLNNEYVSRAHTCIPIMDYNKAIQAKNHCFSRDSFLT